MYKHSILLVQFVLLLSLNFASAQQQNNQEKPNIIFILTDDQRNDAVGYAGNPYVSTPAIDKLAKEGTVFNTAIVTTPICAASRATILTGLYERTHKFNFQTGNIRDEYMENSYPTVLKNNGYQTAFFGKYGVYYDDLDKQFDIYDSYDRNNRFHDKRGYFYKTIDNDTVHLTRYTGQQALDFIDGASTDKPFSLSLSFSAPHAHDVADDQYFWQDTVDNLLQNVTIPKPFLREEKYSLRKQKVADGFSPNVTLSEMDFTSDKYFDAQPDIVRRGFNRVRWKWRYDTPEKYQHSLKGYYRMISGIDLEVAKIRQKLKEKGLDKNTVIIFMGDNGYFLGERQFAGKWLMYDNSIRVPMVIYDPRGKNHQEVDDMVLNVDIPHTILDLAGVEAPTSWQGKTLIPIVNQETNTLARDTILIEHLWDFNEIPPSEGVRTKKWKYFRYVNDKSLEELYDLEIDPQEINNLIGRKKYKKVADQLRDKLERLIIEKSDDYSFPVTDLTVELIRETETEVKILDLNPEFGWTVPVESNFQSAYQILVASSQSILDNNNGDIWDSKRVKSSNSNGIEYEGKPLERGKTYYWKVRIWDDTFRTMNYSESQSFSTAQVESDMISTENKFIVDKISPVKLEDRGNFQFIDFGKAAFATMSFNYKAKNPHTLTIRIGEMLDGNQMNRTPPEKSSIRYQELKVDVKPGKTQYQIPIKQDARNTLPKAVALPKGFPVLLPFRYAEIEGAKSEVKAEDFTQLAYHTFWNEEASLFGSDNDILNQVWDLSKYSIKATTFNGLYVDGDRERIPYEADAYLNQLSHYTVDREYAIARRTIEYFMKNPTWPTEWQQHVALMFYADYMYTGNTELIEKYYDELKFKTLYELSNEQGLISSENVTTEFMYKLGFKKGYKKSLTDIIDWPSAGWGGDPTNKGERDGYVITPYNTVVNAFFYENMRIMAEFAQILGKTEEHLDFQFRAAQAKKAINQHMFDKAKGIYLDGIGTDHASLHANMMPLAFGIVPEQHKKTVVDFIKSRGMACSVFGSQYLLDGLYNAGAEDYALELLTSTSDRSWYNMIRIGSTITLEAWDNKYKNNLDWNHAWGAVPANIIPRGLWGIQPITPGFETAIIKPQMGDLKSSEIEVPTIKGTIKGKFNFINGRYQTYDIEIPGNMIAEFSLKGLDKKQVTLNGEKMSPAFKTLRLLPGMNKIELKVNSF